MVEKELELNSSFFDCNKIDILLGGMIMIVYKKVRQLKDGKYYPLFINKREAFRFGEVMKCGFYPTKGFSPRSINGINSDEPIGGWHSCPLPEASWIADELSTGEKRVWMECEAENVVEYHRPQGIWYLSEYIKPLRILSEKDIKLLLA